MDSATAVQNVLAHHGVKGMKWGSRKSRSSGSKEVSVKTGTNVIGKTSIKTSGGEHLPAHPDAVAARVIQQKLAKSGKHALSNGEIQTLVNRHNLEQQVSRVPKNNLYSQATQHVSNVLKSKDGKQSIELAKAASKTKVARKALATLATTAAVAAA